MNSTRLVVIAIVLFLGLIVLSNSLYVVDMTRAGRHHSVRQADR